MIQGKTVKLFPDDNKWMKCESEIKASHITETNTSNTEYLQESLKAANSSLLFEHVEHRADCAKAMSLMHL